MAARFSVRVLAPVDGAVPDGIVVDALPDEEPAAPLVSLLSPQPRAGRAQLGPRRTRALLQAVADHQPRAVLFVGGHLAAASPTIDRPIFVDFPTLAVRGTGLEALKARWWEAVEARRAVAVSAASADEVDLLTSWGARAVLVDGRVVAGGVGSPGRRGGPHRGGIGRIVSPTSSLRLTDTGVRRARLRGQWLSGRVPAGRTVDDVVGRLVGVQAQDVTAAALAIRARSRGLVVADVDAAREDRRVVLTWSLRGTRHLHRAEDVRWLLARLGPTFLRPSKRAEQLGIAGQAGDRAVGVLASALAADGPLTRDQVKDRLAPHGVDPSGQAAIHVIARAAMEGVLCVLPGERYVLLDGWIGPATTADVPEPGELARRYLGPFGPASVADFAAWSGLGPPAARREWSAIEAELIEVAPSAWLLAADADRAAAAARRRAPTRLVGAFDSLLLAYADRRVHLSPDHAPLVNVGGGMVKALVVDDSRVEGTWSRPGGRVDVRPFLPSSAGNVDREADDVRRFLGTERGP